MSTTSAPPPKKVNRLGLEVINYKGSKTTLCAECGHNSISERIVGSDHFSRLAGFHAKGPSAIVGYGAAVRGDRSTANQRRASTIRSRWAAAA